MELLVCPLRDGRDANALFKVLNSVFGCAPCGMRMRDWAGGGGRRPCVCMRQRAALMASTQQTDSHNGDGSSRQT